MNPGFSIAPKSASGTDGVKPQLTSLIDVMTILLVFLIQSFSVDGNLITPAADMVLPHSSSKNGPEVVTSVMVTRDAILVDQQPVASLRATDADSMMIPALLAHLQARHTGDGRLMIQADRELPFDQVRRVMFTCSKAGFGDFSVLVLQEEG